MAMVQPIGWAGEGMIVSGEVCELVSGDRSLVFEQVNLRLS